VTTTRQPPAARIAPATPSAHEPRDRRAVVLLRVRGDRHARELGAELPRQVAQGRADAIGVRVLDRRVARDAQVDPDQRVRAARRPELDGELERVVPGHHQPVVGHPERPRERQRGAPFAQCQ
jgi:hypothetical protein